MRIKLLLLLLFLAIAFVGCLVFPPDTFIKTFDEPGIWKSVEIREGITKDDLWKIVVDSLSQKYDLEVLEKDSGYLRSSWKYTYIIRGTVSDKYRSRIIVKFVGDDWEVAQVKCESNWLETRGWILGYDTRLLEDVYGDIQGRVGRIRR